MGGGGPPPRHWARRGAWGPSFASHRSLEAWLAQAFRDTRPHWGAKTWMLVYADPATDIRTTLQGKPALPSSRTRAEAPVWRTRRAHGDGQHGAGGRPLATVDLCEVPGRSKQMVPAPPAASGDAPGDEQARPSPAQGGGAP